MSGMFEEALETTTQKEKPSDGVIFPYPDDPDFFDPGIPKGIISPSGFGTYRKCPRQYEYAYILEMRKPPGISMLKGKAIHHGAEVVHKHTILKGGTMPLGEAEQAVSDHWDHGAEEIEDWLDNDGNVVHKGVAKDNTVGNFRAYYTQAVPLIRPVAAEEAFAQKIGTVPVRGIIDLIDSIEGEYNIGDDPNEPPPRINAVADLKTTKMKWAQQKLDYDTQMTIYAYVKNTDFIRVDLLVDQKKGATYCPMISRRSRQEKAIMVEDLEQTVDLIKKGVFPRCDPTSWACTPKFCGFHSICRGKKG